MPSFQNIQTLVVAQLYFVGITSKSQYSKCTVRQQKKWKTITEKRGFFLPSLEPVCAQFEHIINKLHRKQNSILQEHLTLFSWIFEGCGGDGIKPCVESERAWICIL
jgi:hypothetical protein